MQVTQLIVRFGESGNHAWLWNNLEMRWGDNEIRVPTGFKTDFASIPQAVRSLIPQLGRWTAGAVAHDYAYWCGESLGFTQKSADQMLNELMKEAGVKWWRRNTIYYALRMGGWCAWNKHRKDGHTVNNALDQ